MPLPAPTVPTAPTAPTVCPVIVIGAGISGLACAYQLQQNGIPVRLIEAGNRPGGMIATVERDGFRFDLGPQSFLTSEPLLALIDALGLRGQLLYANPRAPRYILVGGKLVAAPLAPPSLLTTPLLSASTKFRLFTEIARHTHPPPDDESIAAFVRRKFGNQMLERLVAPFVSGVYAGDPERLSMRAAFPKLHEMETLYGSVLRGAMKSRPAKGTPRAGLCSFREGMETLPRAISARLGNSLFLDTSVTRARLGTNGKPSFELSVTQGEQRKTLAARAIVVAAPTNPAATILGGVNDQFTALFARIEYAPVAVVSTCYRREQIRGACDGFGFLVPRAEGLQVLGTVFNSSLFPGRAPEGMVTFTSFAGGATAPEFCKLSAEKIVAAVCDEVGRVLSISGPPVATNLHRYERAIPQYNLGHTRTIQSLESLAAATPGLFLAGNYLGGPAIGACVEQANRTAQNVRVYLASIGVAGVGAVAHA